MNTIRRIVIDRVIADIQELENFVKTQIISRPCGGLVLDKVEVSESSTQVILGGGCPNKDITDTAYSILSSAVKTKFGLDTRAIRLM